MNTSRRSAVRQIDVRRIVRAVHAEGVVPRTIRVEASGEVAIDVGDFVAMDVSPLDEWRGRHGSTAQRH